ncbi:XrtA/PEP-CTERM system TPR-repeat protein PrsT [Niveibacterium terrae]|uniref:XrtA/PEP-CTERM system TPR-repeat protein PrsT n=1 Tax=Niveibacterium terrae TaxID=3373598 RepID=UPI003A94E6B1
MPGFRSKKLIAALTLGLLLAACGDSPEKMMSSARDYLAKGDVNAATIQLKNALQKKPDLAEARLLFGQILLDSGDMIGAEKELRKALDAGQPKELVIPLLSRSLLSQGKSKEWLTELDAITANTSALKVAVAVARSDAWLVDQQIEKAESAAKEALGVDPGSVGAKLTLSRIAAVRKDFACALSQVDAILAKNPLEYDALNLRADLFQVDGKVDKALADISTQIRLKPRDIKPRLHKVQILISLSRLDEADAELVLAHKAMPSNLQVRLVEAMLALKRGRNEAARDAARQVLKANSEFVPALIVEGTALFRLKDYAAAQTQLEHALARAPRAAEARRILARCHLAVRDPARALEVIQPLLDPDKPDPQSFLIAGQAALQTGDFPHSQQYFAKASASNPKDPAAKTRMGVVRLLEGDLSAGIRDLESAAALSPDANEALIALAMTHLHEGNLAKARATADELIRRAPKRGVSFNVLGAVLVQSKDMQGARQAFEKALQVEPGFVPAAANLARLDLDQGKPDQAKARFQAILDKDGKNTGAALGLARLLIQTHAKPEAVRKVLERAIAANAMAVEPRMALVELLLRTGDKKAAQAAGNDLAAAFPRNAPALSLAAAAQLQAGDTQQGISLLQKVVQLQPKSAKALIMLADGQYSTRDTAGAEASLRRALQLQPDSNEANRRMFALKIDQKKIDDAVALARDLQKAKPKDSQGFFLEGEARSVAKDWNASAVAYARALELTKDGLLAAKLHNALLLAGKASEANRLRSDWIRTQPKDLAFPAYLAERALAAREYQEAARIYKGLIEIEPKNALILNNLAWVAGQLKDPKAISYVDRALALVPDAPAALDTKAGLLDAGGQVAPAQELWRRAVGLAPKNGEIRLNLARSLIKTGNKSGARSELDQLVRGAGQNSPVRQEAEKLLKTL